MVAQTAHIVDGLGADAGYELVVGRIGGAGEHEVLPYHDACAVAKFVETVVLVDAAAPHADHVHVHVLGVEHMFLVFFAGDAGEEVVERHHVHAFHEHGLAVDLEVEVVAVLVLVVMQNDGAESDFLVIGVGSCPVDVHCRGEVVEICLAQTVGPPEVRILHCGRHFDAVHPFLESHSFGRNLLAVGCDCEISSRNIAVGNHLAHQGEVGAAVGHLVLDYLYVGQTRAVPGLEHHGAPDARSHQTGTPVPAVVIAGLAGEDAHEFVEYASVLRLVGSGVESVVVLVAFGEVDFDG